MSSGDPCHFVIFGATGNLAGVKLLPALYQLETDARLPPDLHFVAFARRPWRTDDWRDYMQSVLRERMGDTFRPEVYAGFARRFDYIAGDLNDPQSYVRLMDDVRNRRQQSCDNMVFYLAIKPADFAAVVVNLDNAGINRERGRHRIVVEKPFGENLETARALNQLLHRYFDEEQIYRIDHYLGKETVQNLFVFRFANTLIEPVWNRSYIDHVQITVAEDIGVDGRADYYDHAGALRDMLQNHLMQLLTVAAMEPPASMEADALRDEKVKALRSVRPIPDAEVGAYVVRAQYGAGDVAGRRVPGYREEPGVPPTSTTETFVAAKFFVDNWRWRGVPFYLRTGKRLARQMSLIAIRFRYPPQLLFRQAAVERVDPNWIVLSIQPSERMLLEIHAKQPGLGLKTRVVKLDASYRPAHESPMEAYKTLLLDVIEGDRSLFLRFDEVEWAWRVVDPILRRWALERDPIAAYPAGSWGPEEANRLFESADQHWRNEI